MTHVSMVKKRYIITKTVNNQCKEGMMTKDIKQNPVTKTQSTPVLTQLCIAYAQEDKTCSVQIVSLSETDVLQ